MQCSQRRSKAQVEFENFVLNLNQRASLLAAVYPHLIKVDFQDKSLLYEHLITRESLKQTLKVGAAYGLEKITYCEVARETLIKFTDNHSAVNFYQYLEPRLAVKLLVAKTTGDTTLVDLDCSFVLNLRILVGPLGHGTSRFNNYNQDLYLQEIQRLDKLVAKVLVEGETALNVILRN